MKKYLMTAALMGLLTALAVGCANNNRSQTNVNQDPIAKQLYAAPVVANMSPTAELNQCNETTATSALDQSVTPVTSSANAMWTSCEQIYACSPTTTQFLKDQFQSGATFSFGYINLRQLKVPKLGDKVAGMYLAHTDRVFLDVSMNTPRDACALLLHELVHRFDPVANGGEESLRTEFRAYWYQTAFNDELILDQGTLGQNVRQHITGGYNSSTTIPYHTRESLMAGIAQLYGFTPDSSFIYNYPKLPREPKTATLADEPNSPDSSQEPQPTIPNEKPVLF